MSGRGSAWMLGVLMACAPALGQVIPKQIAAPPDQILAGSFDLPEPALTGTASGAAMLPITFSAQKGSFIWRTEAPIDDASLVQILAFGPNSETWQLSVVPPDGIERSLQQGAQTPGIFAEQTGLEIGRTWQPAASYTLLNQAAGRWSITVRSERQPEPRDTHGYLFVKTASSLQVYTHLSSHDLLVGRPLGLVTTLMDSKAAPIRARIDTAEVEIRAPDGRIRRLTMNAAGALASADFLPQTPGDHTAHIVVLGTHENGKRFVRTSQLVFPVLADDVRLQGSAVIVQDMPGVRRISIPLARANRSERAIVSAEVWEVSRAGQSRPVCWLSRMATQEHDGVIAAYSLFIDERWLAGINGNLELRNVRVQCCDTSVPIARSTLIPLRGFEPVEGEPGPITREMLVGRPRPDLSLPIRGEPAPRSPRVAGGHNLMLVHGYCAGGNPWPSADFSGSLEVFSDPNQNRSHDEFANLLFSLGSGSKSFGIIAHSQGGAAALHLWTYYFSGLDWADGPRLIQSVGTPYQGTPLAGNLALLGSIFGQGCGGNTDLSPDGAALWLAGIPPQNRAAVTYWTTAPTSGSCNFLSGLFLSNPEDGVVESARGQLPGGNNMGLVSGWCHTTGMSQPAQYFDSARNAEMNAEAAR